MPLPGYGNLTSSDTFVGGQSYTRFKGPALIGTLADSKASTVGPLASPGGVIMVESSAATSTSVTNPALTNLLSTLAASISVASFVYIPQTTGPVATSSFASAESAPPYTGCGAVLLWDAANSRLMVYSTASGSGVWMGTRIANSTSTTAGAFTSS